MDRSRITHNVFKVSRITEISLVSSIFMDRVSNHEAREINMRKTQSWGERVVSQNFSFHKYRGRFMAKWWGERNFYSLQELFYYSKLVYDLFFRKPLHTFFLDSWRYTKRFFVFYLTPAIISLMVDPFATQSFILLHKICHIWCTSDKSLIDNRQNTRNV